VLWAARVAKMGYRWKLGKGDKIRFWEDLWIGSFRILYRNNWAWAAATSGPQPIRVGEAQHLVMLPPHSRRRNPNGLPQPIRIRVRGGAASSAVATPGRRP
jgi:hypothetical protein